MAQGAGTQNEIGFAENFDFSGTNPPAAANGLQLNGQLWIGTTALNAGGTHINVSTLTPGPGISITNGPGTITINNTSLGSADRITGDSGPALSPDWSILGQQAGTIAVMSTVGTAASTLRIENRTWTTPYIVDASSTVGLRGTFTTIQAAITAASSGNTIFIRPGTYTENLTLKAGVNLTAYEDELTPNVTIIGKLTMTAAGTATVSGIRLQTNSDYVIEITGASAVVVNFSRCYMNATNFSAIHITNASGSVTLSNTNGDLGTTTIAMFIMTGGGLNIRYSIWSNSGNSLTASTISAGSVNVNWSSLQNQITTSSTAGISVVNSQILTGGINQTAVTVGGSGTNVLQYSEFDGGTASAISIGASGTNIVQNVRVDSSNTNAVSGAGSITYGDITYTGSSSLMNTTTQVALYTNQGKWKASGQPSFLATNSATDSDVTGDATVYTIIFDNEVKDQDSNYNNGTGVFTAPVTGQYLLTASVYVLQVAVGNTLQTLTLNVSNRAFNTVMSPSVINVGGDLCTAFSMIVDMDAADTASVTIKVSGGTKIIDVRGGSDGFTSFAGQLIA